MAQMPMAPKAKKPGKKVNTAKMAQAMRKSKAPAVPVDPEADAMAQGGYDPRHGVGSG